MLWLVSQCMQAPSSYKHSTHMHRHAICKTPTAPINGFQDFGLYGCAGINTHMKNNSNTIVFGSWWARHVRDKSCLSKANTHMHVIVDLAIWFDDAASPLTQSGDKGSVKPPDHKKRLNSCFSGCISNHSHTFMYQWVHFQPFTHIRVLVGAFSTFHTLP